MPCKRPHRLLTKNSSILRASEAFRCAFLLAPEETAKYSIGQMYEKNVVVTLYPCEQEKQFAGRIIKLS
jgi:hypothetical protein